MRYSGACEHTSNCAAHGQVAAKLEARGSEARVSNLLAVKSTALAVRAPAELAVATGLGCIVALHRRSSYHIR